MNEAEFMRELSQALAGLSDGERLEILEDFTEHFRAGRQNGRTEAEIAANLGNPRMLARQFTAGLARGTSMGKGGTVFSIAVAIIADLFLFGFILGAGISLLVMYPAWAITTGAGLLAAAASVLDAIIPIDIISSGLHPLLSVLAGLLIANVGALLFLANHWLFKIFYKLCKKFYHWNLKMIRGE